MEVSDDVESRRAASGLGPVSGDELKRRLTPNLQKKNFFINRPSFPDQFLQMTELKSDVINMDHVDKNDISVFNYETNNDKEGEILYHGLPFENVKSILQNGYEAPNIFGKTDVNKIFSYMLSKDNKVNEYGAIFKLKLIGFSLGINLLLLFQSLFVLLLFILILLLSLLAASVSFFSL